MCDAVSGNEELEHESSSNSEDEYVSESLNDFEV